MKTIINNLKLIKYCVNKHIIINKQVYMGTLMYKKIFEDKTFKLFQETGCVNRYTYRKNRRLTYSYNFDNLFIYEIDKNNNIIDETRTNYNMWIEKYINNNIEND